MALLVCKVDKLLRISKNKSSFPNKEDLNYDFKANVPLEVIPEVAKAYSEAYPNIYKIVDGLYKPEDKEPEPPAGGSNQPPAFDAKAYLTVHPAATEDELKELKQTDLLAICEALELKAHPNTGVPKLAVMIAQELEVKNAKEE
jgi:hypothetical protein